MYTYADTLMHTIIHAYKCKDTGSGSYQPQVGNIHPAYDLEQLSDTIPLPAAREDERAYNHIDQPDGDRQCMKHEFKVFFLHSLFFLSFV